MRALERDQQNFFLRLYLEGFGYEHKVNSDVFTPSHVYYPFSLLLVNLDSDIRSSRLLLLIGK